MTWGVINMKEKQICTIPYYAKVKPYYYIRDNGDVISKVYTNNKVLSQRYNTKGYLMVSLNEGFKCVKVHRLVALAFIPNKENKPQVNHIDGNKENNNANNLEWVTNQENMNHAKETGLRNPAEWGTGKNNYQFDKYHKDNKTVLQYTSDGQFIKEYPSQASAARSIGRKTSYYKYISQACRGVRDEAGGYKWKYKNNI